MTVSTIAAVATGSSFAVSIQNTKASLSAGAGTSSASARSNQDVVTFPSPLQQQAGSLVVAAQSISESGAQLDTASGGASQVNSLVGQLLDIATRANDSGLSSSEREVLDGEFQSLRNQITNIGDDTTFNGQPVLNGTASVQVGSQTQTIGGLTDADLFGKNSDINVLTQQSAQQAVVSVTQAQSYVSTQQASIAAAQADVEYASATVESAVQNQEASRSNISDTEITSGTSASAQSQVQSNAVGAQAAQTNRLPADILQLLAD